MSANRRGKKIEWLKNAILSFFAKKPEALISRDKLIAEFCLANASTERTAKECLKILEQTKFIKIEGGNISK